MGMGQKEELAGTFPIQRCKEEGKVRKKNHGFY